MDRCHTDPKRTQMPAKTIIPRKTLIIFEGETKILHDKTIYTISCRKPSPTKMVEVTRPKQGKLTPRKSKKVIFQQSQKKIDKQT